MKLCPRPAGSSQHFPDPLAVFGEKGREMRKGGRRERGREGEGLEGRDEGRGKGLEGRS